jgi:hypothetical protein
MRDATRRTLLALAGSVLLGSAAGAAPAADTPPPDADASSARAGFEEGELHRLRKDLADLMPLALQNGRLVLDRDHWHGIEEDDSAVKEEIEKLVKKYAAQGMDEQRARRLAESMARSRIHSGVRGALRQVRTAENFSMSTSVGGASLQVSKGPGSFRALLRETGQPGRILHFAAEAKRLRILLLSPDDEFVLMVRQEPDGTFGVLDLAGATPLRIRAGSFAAFCRTHRKYALERLLPLLAHNGVGVPPLPHSQATRGQVLTMLRSALAPGQEKDAATLIAQLDDPAYARREQATQRLAAGFARYRRHIEKAAADESRSAEAQARLRKILADAKPRTDLHAVVTAYGLLEDPQYLVELLAATKGPDDHKVLAAQLEKLTGQRFGTDLRKWQAHLPQAGPPTRPAASSPSR